MLIAKKGETIIEVGLAISIFATVALIAIGLMSSGINSAQSALEITMARNEIDAQAEAIRFVHNSFLSERELSENKDASGSSQQYHKLWKKITKPTSLGGFSKKPHEVKTGLNVNTCDELYKTTKKENIFEDNAFVLNTRFLAPSNINKTYIDSFLNPNPGDIVSYDNLLEEIIISSKNNPNKFNKSPLYPRLIFTNNQGNSESENSSKEILEKGTKEYLKVKQVEGIWVIAIASEKEINNEPEFYDFHIRTCWYSPGHKNPTTIGTIIRLYNPESIEGVRHEG